MHVPLFSYFRSWANISCSTSSMSILSSSVFGCVSAMNTYMWNLSAGWRYFRLESFPEAKDMEAWVIGHKKKRCVCMCVRHLWHLEADEWVCCSCRGRAASARRELPGRQTEQRDCGLYRKPPTDLHPKLQTYLVRTHTNTHIYLCALELIDLLSEHWLFWVHWPFFPAWLKG